MRSLFCVLVAVAFAQAAVAGEVREIHIDNFTFTPQALSVPAGTTVVFVNRDDTPHRVASTKGLFKSSALDTDEQFRWTFAKPGTYAYFCTMHPHMTGAVTVTAK